MGELRLSRVSHRITYPVDEKSRHWSHSHKDDLITRFPNLIDPWVAGPSPTAAPAPPPAIPSYPKNIFSRKNIAKRRVRIEFTSISTVHTITRRRADLPQFPGPQAEILTGTRSRPAEPGYYESYLRSSYWYEAQTAVANLVSYLYVHCSRHPSSSRISTSLISPLIFLIHEEKALT